jgi:thiamine pyrophosphate-dependent acetolactate synthase large subunit-like protein
LKNQDTHIRWDYRKTDDFVHILSNDDKLQHIDGQLSDIDKNTITTDQLNGLVTDLGHVLLDTAQKLQGKVKIKNVAPNCDQKPWYDKLCKEKRKNVSISTGGVSFLIPEYFFKEFQNPFVSFFDSALSSDAHFSLYF